MALGMRTPLPPRTVTIALPGKQVQVMEAVQSLQESSSLQLALFFISSATSTSDWHVSQSGTGPSVCDHVGRDEEWAS